jgi:antitoxin (DNA-binding transcriptional repressor) of toxin-antitoxin stability system
VSISTDDATVTMTYLHRHASELLAEVRRGKVVEIRAAKWGDIIAKLVPPDYTPEGTSAA